MATLDLDWINPQLIKKCVEESKEHRDRISFMKNHTRAWKYTLLTNQALMPVGDDDVEIDTSPNGRPIAYENRIAKDVRDIVSISLKNKPIVRHYPYSDRPHDGDLANNLDDILGACWRPDGGNVSNIIQTHWKGTVVSGLCVGKYFWDASNQLTGDGQVGGIVVPHKDLYLDPYGLNDQRLLDLRYIVHVTRHSKAYIRERFGSEGEIALGERNAKGRKTLSGKSDRWSRFKDYVNEELINPIFGTGGGGSKDPQSKVEDLEEVFECWLFPTVSSDSNLLSGETIEERDFPYGVVATMVRDHIVKRIGNPNASNRDLLESEENPDLEPQLKNHIIGSKRHPFVPMYWEATSDPDGRNGVYCAKGIVTDIIPIQVSFNALCTTIQKNALTLASPAIEVMKGAIDNLPPDAIQWFPGQIFVNNPNVSRGQPGIHIIQGAPLPAYVFQQKESKERAISDMAGINDLIRGLGSNPQMGTSHTPYGVMAGAQEASFTPLITPLAELERGIYDISTVLEGLMQQNYEEGRIINVSDKGKQLSLEWKDAYLLASFIRVVVSGSTTPMVDITRQQDVMLINQMVTQVLQSQDPYVLESAVLTLKNMNKPYTFDYIQLLQKKIAELTQMQAEQAQLGAQLAGQEMQGQIAPQPQQGEQSPDWDSLLEEIRTNISPQEQA